ncbi:hypothetical protein NEMIN01_1336 [Nematocida minor]|uniref:uncharacterized protein n=1 Tax=Nematocida minor TaxID=1912983 RepID=UPI00221F6D1D|nr:uncharacterized protein NEMIN01_1336 [Nematocida minor]KAI5191067.1 hypothetical protein NEMIN01_1336 [Nematocida minor]
MLLSFHHTEPRNRSIIKPTEYTTLEDALEMPNIEEVDSMPSFSVSEHSESAKLEEIGADILNKLYATDSAPAASIKCKGISREEYRF